MQTLAVANFSLPGDSGFPLNAMYQKPGSKAEAGYKAHQWLFFNSLYFQDQWK